MMVKRLKNMHQNYTKIMCVSKATKQFYAKAFGIEVFGPKENFISIFLPHITKTLTLNYRKISSIKQNFKNKSFVFYIFSFRKFIV